MCADGLPSEVDMVMSDKGGEFVGGDFGIVCRQYCKNQGITKANRF